MNEPSQSNMLFGALVARTDAVSPGRTEASADETRRIGVTTVAVVGATLATLLWIAVSAS
jgi:hypothetical protein